MPNTEPPEQDNMNVLTKEMWECSSGWSSLIEPIIQQASIEGGTILQIKAKFGRLRIYIEGGSALLYKMLDEAEIRSGDICEICGADGCIVNLSGWLKTRCYNHINK